MLVLAFSILVLGVARCQNRAMNLCSFNTMCTCQWGQHDGIADVACLDVPLAKLPDFPRGRIAQIDVTGSGLVAVESEPLAASRVDSLRLMSNSIKHIDEKAFSSMIYSLASLDLSYNELDTIPFNSLRDLKNLQWLNLDGNQIRSLHGDWSHMQDTLTSLLVGENDINELSSTIDFDSSSDGSISAQTLLCLQDLQGLSTLNIVANKLSRIERHSLPHNIQTLALSHNLLHEFPSAGIENLHKLMWLDLRGNQIHQLPQHHTFKPPLILEKLNLGENGLRSLPKNVFNGTMRVRDLSIDFNRLETLSVDAFKSFKPGRIVLNYNHLTTLHAKAFVGAENTLEYLALEHNKLAQVPTGALNKIKVLKYLYLASNTITEIPEYAFSSFSSSLRALSLSGNLLTNIPSDALTNCTRLSHLNVGYNQIFDVREEDFINWADNLDTLLLRSNRISNLDENVFNLTTNLRELSLSFNPLNYLHPNVFRHLSDTLESLEMSFSLAEENFPTELLRPLNNLLWLALDNNNIESLQRNSLDSFTQLQYLNLEANKIRYIDPNVFKGEVHSQLTDLRLSNNKLEVIEAKTFSSLSNLQSLSLFANRITVLQSHAFYNLTSLVKLVISDNSIKEIKPSAFLNLPILTQLDLQNNNMFTFSMDAFKNTTHPQYPMNLNLSLNNLFEVFPSEDILNINTIDLSHNNLQSPPKDMLEKIANTIRTLHLSYNRIEALELEAFGPLEKLEILSLKKNNIAAVKKHAFVGLDSLQVLDISFNEIKQLHVGQFSYLQNLRILDISNNQIHYLPKDIFRNTKIERLDLSNNGFTVMPSTVLNDISLTLRDIKINNNNIEHIDSTMFPSTPYLLHLDLSHNRLNLLPDNVFTSLGNLQKLDLSFNPLRANYKELFHYAQSLKYLNLANIGMKSAPTLPLPNLVFLNLSSNGIEDVTRYSMKGLTALRHLDLSENQLKAIPSQVWNHLPILKTLDLSNNPIKEITSKCFYGLNELQNLIIHSLHFLDHFDADALSHLKLLTSLTTQTSKFHLKKILSSITSLRKLSVEVTEYALTDQLHGVLNERIKYLDIWGNNLRLIDRDAFFGLENNAELLLRIRNTQVEELPSGMVANFNRIPHLRLDLRDNMLNSLTPDVFYTNMTTWESVGTKLISGGLLLDNNPWTCDCRLVWLGHWLRRWVRETLQAHAADARAAHAAHVAARSALCEHPDNGRVEPIAALRPEHMACHASALSNTGVPRARRWVTPAAAVGAAWIAWYAWLRR